MLQDNRTIVRRFIDQTINQGRLDDAVEFV